MRRERKFRSTKPMMLIMGAAGIEPATPRCVKGDSGSFLLLRRCDTNVIQLRSALPKKTSAPLRSDPLETMSEASNLGVE
jgi:hypothetical protein